MANRRVSITKTVLFGLVLTGLLLASCNGTRSTGSPTDSAPTAEQETPSEPTPIPSPTLPPGKVWLVVPPASDAQIVEQIKTKLDELTVQQGYILEQTDNLAQSQLDQSAKVVVWVGQNPDIANLAGSSAQTQFILVGPGQVEPSANLTIVRTSPLGMSFMAGFIATLVAPDRRSAGLFSADDPLNPQLQNSFANGGAYLCGRCTPLYAPVVFFPVTMTVSPTLGLDGWKAGVESLNQNRIEVLFIPTEAVTSDFLTYLNEQRVKVISTANPPDGFANQWVATVSQDAASALSQLWPELIADGYTGKAVNAVTKFTDVNDQILTPGKLEFAEKVAAELDGGWIKPLSIP